MSTKPKAIPNHLIHEQSAYLRQHAYNPVRWHPWGKEAFELAKTHNRPIFLSIGYSTCHWCHVMETESFEDEATASILNDSYISIKVDREERPDVDHQYMSFVVAMQGSGGWPLNVFLAPETLKPFYGGTYFPLNDRPGMPSFKFLLTTIANRWKEDPDALMASSEKLYQAIEETTESKEPSQAEIDPQALIQAGQTLFLGLSRAFDGEYGGFGKSGPKFPTPVQLHFLFSYARRMAPDPQATKALNMVHHTLYYIANGGIRDHLAGGFHRYSVDRFWAVPHYEKMLYDQAQLLSIFAEARNCIPSQVVFGNGHALDPKDLLGVYDEAMRDIVRYVSSRLLSTDSKTDGLFYSAEDADSKVHTDDKESIEGAYYTWTMSQIESIINSPQDSTWFFKLYDLHLESDVSEPVGVLVKRPFTPGLEQIDKDRLKRILNLLGKHRESRPKCIVDHKILVSWNAMMIKALAQASILEPSWLAMAIKAMDTLLDLGASKQDGLLHCSHTIPPSLPGFGSDYALLIDALWTLYEYAPHKDYDDMATRLQKSMDDFFYSSNRPSGYSMTKPGDIGIMDKREHFSISEKSFGHQIDPNGAEPGLHAIVLGNLIRLLCMTSTMDAMDSDPIRTMVSNAVSTSSILSSPLFLSHALMLAAERSKVPGENDADILRLPSIITIEASLGMDHIFQEAADVVHHSGRHLPFCLLFFKRSAKIDPHSYNISICKYNVGCLAPLRSIEELKSFIHSLPCY